jgi:hypothetical protein
MQAITRKLIYVRRIARWLLVGQRLCQTALLLAAAALVLGLGDYVLRLPGEGRLIIGLTVAAGLGVWLLSRLVRAVQFRPGLSELALRVEALFPQLAGRFASAVEFADHPEQYAEPRRTGALAEASVSDVQRQVADLPLRRLIKPARSLTWAGAALLALAAVLAVGFATPRHTAIAAQRWLSPMNSPAWPKRTDVLDDVNQHVFALDSDIPIKAKVTRGHHEDMRVTLRYRFVRRGQEPGPWQQTLMTGQRADTITDARFETLIQPPAQLRASSADQPGPVATLEYTIAAGDDQTRAKSLKLVPRPAVSQAIATLTPPDYAKGLIQTRTAALHSQTGRVASTAALAATRVRLDVKLNKPIPLPDDPAALMPGLNDLSLRFVETREGESTAPKTATEGERRSADRFTLTFTLSETATSQLALEDQYAIASHGRRQYRFEATEDKPPSVSLTEPAADREVLPEAVVAVAAEGRDDVALRWLRMLAELPEPDSQSEQTTAVRQLAETSGRRPTMQRDLDFDLAEHTLEPGDEVILTARVRDGYELDGQTHDPVTSAPRTLTIIDKPTLLSQVRESLGAVRQQSIKLDQRQGQLRQAQARRARPGQQAVSRRLNNQQQQIESLKQRLQRNRVDEPGLDEQLNEAGALLDQAGQASDAASQQLEQAEQAKQQDNKQAANAHDQKARNQQQQVQNKLKSLVALLDRGRDAMALKLKLDKLTRTQKQLADRTRELLPRTVGQSKENLDEPVKKQLDELAEQQDELAEQARRMVRQMQETARTIKQSEKIDDKAAAKTLSEAASIAQRQGLNQQMKEAAKQAKQNKLSRAGGQQGGAAQTMQQMQQTLDQQEQKRQQMLRRQLAKLAQLLQQLIDAQKRQRQALANQADDAIALLGPGQNQLRRRTMAAEQHAAKNKQTQPAAQPIGQAVTAQSQAVQALRAQNAMPADAAEAQAIKHLTTALQRIREAQRKVQENEQQKKRRELRTQYQKLAEQQRKLTKDTQPLVDVKDLDRQQQATLRDLADEETSLRERVKKLGEKVQKTVVFRRMHEQVDSTLQRVASAMNDGRADAPVTADQQFVASMLHSMAEALKPPERDEQFARRQGGGGGGGGGAGQQQAPVPPYAELKLLRAGQAALHQRTEQLADVRDQGSEAAGDRLRELSTRQQGLAELGKTLLRQVQQQSAGDASQNKHKVK